MLTGHSCGAKNVESAPEAEWRHLNDRETAQRHFANSLEELRAITGFRFGHVELTDPQKKSTVLHFDFDDVMMFCWFVRDVSLHVVIMESEWSKTEKIKWSVL